MGDSFLGYQVALTLHSGIRLHGTVAAIDPVTQQMTLHQVLLFFPGQPALHTPVYGVVGKDIADLNILAGAPPPAAAPAETMAPVAPAPAPAPPMPVPVPATASQSTPPHIPSTTITQAENTQNGHLSPPIDHQHLAAASPRRKKSPKVKPSKSTSATTDRRRTRQRQYIETNDWASEDVKGYISQEFDFQANLDMFDKAKVFAEIREADQTNAETLLVSINRLPKKINLLPSENVLERRVSQSNPDTVGDESDDASVTPPSAPPAPRRASVPYASLITVNDKAACPTVSPLQMAHAEHECVSVFGFPEDQLVENGGRGLCQLVLQLIAQQQVQRTKAHPVHVVILVSHVMNGAYGLCTARHMLNHGHKVSVCMASGDMAATEPVQRQKSLLATMGCYVYHGMEGLQKLGKADLIVDAMLGAETKLSDLQEERSTYLSLGDMIQWANDDGAPILSVDFPSGMDAGTGRPQHPTSVIRPMWTACLAAPKTGCIAPHVTGDLYLIDLGFPRQCWKRAGLKKPDLPWGTHFVMALAYV
ncbi:YjeF N-terminal domain-containing protein [Gongronella butleri]|nr:YjeF N-terminal domain-containing protein [Gongronella butleri]